MFTNRVLHSKSQHSASRDTLFLYAALNQCDARFGSQSTAYGLQSQESTCWQVRSPATTRAMG